MSLPVPPGPAIASRLGCQPRLPVRCFHSRTGISTALRPASVSGRESSLFSKGNCELAHGQRPRMPPPQALPLPAIHYIPPLAMVNVDFANPSLVLGIGLIGCGVVLLQLRNMQTRISRDADIVVAAMVSIVGSTLIFQGWRLDPLLLLCQALTTSVAVWYGFEAFQLRSAAEEEFDDEVDEFLPPPRDSSSPVQQQSYEAYAGKDSQDAGPASPQWVPSSQYGQQYSEWAPQQQWGQAQQQPVGSYLPPGQGRDIPWAEPMAGQDGRWGGSQQVPGAGQPPPPWAGRAYNEATIRYDYYGNPIQEPGTSYEPMYGDFESGQTYGGPAQYSTEGTSYYVAPPGSSDSAGFMAPSQRGREGDLRPSGQYPGPPSSSTQVASGAAGIGAGAKALPPATSRAKVVEPVDDWE